MSTLKAFVDRFALKAGKSSDIVFKEALADDALSIQAILLKREYDKTGMFPDIAIQEIGCIPLVEVDVAECCSIEVGCKVLRTSFKLPEIIEVKDNSSYDYVGGIAGNRPFTYMPPARLATYKHGRFKGTNPDTKVIYYTIKNRYVYVLNDPSVEAITIRGPFVDMRQLQGLLNCKGENCFEEDKHSLIYEHLAPLIDQWLRSSLGMIPTEAIEIDKNK